MEINFNTKETHKFKIGFLYECISSNPVYFFQPPPEKLFHFVYKNEIIIVLTGPVELIGLPTTHCFYKMLTSKGILGHILAESVVRPNSFKLIGEHETEHANEPT